MGKHRKPRQDKVEQSSAEDSEYIPTPSWNRNASADQKMQNFDAYQAQMDEKAHQRYLNMGPVDRAYWDNRHNYR